MRVEIECAEWTIPYPDDLAGRCVSTVLQPLTYVAHDWDAFPWHLTGRVAALLENPEPSFEYFHLTAFFRARAAMLALSKKVIDPGELFVAMRRHRVQAGGMYRMHTLRYLRLFLAQHNYTQLTECEAGTFEAYHAGDVALRHRGHVQRLLGFAEMDYLATLNYLSMTGNMEEQVCGHSLGFWVNGAEMPEPMDVRVRVRRQESGYEVFPAREEAKALIRAGRPVKQVVVRAQRDEGHAADAAGSADGKGQVSEAGKAVLDTKVIGNYRVIQLAGGGRINLATKHKARAFLAYVHKALKRARKQDFYVEEMREGFNAQFTGAAAGKQWKSDRFREDLFKGKEREFDLLFEPLERGSGYYRLKLFSLTGCCAALSSWTGKIGSVCDVLAFLGENMGKLGCDVVGLA